MVALQPDDVTAYESGKTQCRLREMVEILSKATPRFGSPLLAYTWYRSEPLSGFSGQTPMDLVLNGRADEVLEYLDAVDAGIHARTYQVDTTDK